MFKMIYNFFNDDSQFTDSPRPNIAIMLYLIVILFCSLEMVPGWALFNLGWSPVTIWGIGVAVGGLSGLILCSKNPIPGLVGGAACAMSSLFCLQLYLSTFNVLSTLIVIGVIAVGMLPGVCVGYWLREALKMGEAQNRMTS